MAERKPARAEHGLPDHPPLTFDLLVATIGRTSQLKRFLDSLREQTVRTFRIVLIDQNEGDVLGPIVDRYRRDLDLTHLRSQPGLSRARNTGLMDLRGDIVGIPDDDCWYPPELLERVAHVFLEHPEWDGVTGRTVDEAGRPSFVLWAKSPCLVKRSNVWRTAVAVTIFLRRGAVSKIGLFDESLGAGSGTRWGSGEETDYLLRALEMGLVIGYDPGLVVFHESPRPEILGRAAAKGYATGMGNSYVLRKHGYPGRFAALRVLQLVAGSIYFLAQGRGAHARFYWAMARGRAVGWVRARKAMTAAQPPPPSMGK